VTRTTYDGVPIADEPPFGASIVVYRRTPSGLEFLMLHRAHHGADFEGDWAWTPPAGSRQPGEPIEVCARRELHEEVRLELSITACDHDAKEWAVYFAEAPADAEVILDAEHDRFVWIGLNDAVARCSPPLVGAQLRFVAGIVG
jgi:ADP-ribose pyrophosphatase YjhB (NUDIX family)